MENFTEKLRDNSKTNMKVFASGVGIPLDRNFKVEVGSISK